MIAGTRTLAEAGPLLAAAHGARPALIHQRRAVSFAEFHRHAEAVAAGLQTLGVHRGDRVATLGKDGLASYEILFGSAVCGAVLTPINWRLSAAEVGYIVADSEARVLFIRDIPAEVVNEIRAAAPRLAHVIDLQPDADTDPYIAWRDTTRPPIDDVVITEDDPILQIYTSGTTGNPKGVVLAHRTFFRLMQHMHGVGDDWMGLSDCETLLLSLPQFHIGGAWWAVQGLLAGATGVLMDSFSSIVALKLIEQHRITKVPMVPAMIAATLVDPRIAETNISSVTGFLYGGSPIAPRLLQEAMTVFHCDWFQIYGLTETGNMAVCLRPADHKTGNPNRLLAAGKPLPGVEAKIIDRAGNLLPPGQTGEICLKTPSRMVEYWKNPAATAATLVDGWVHTGDAGFLDADGYLTVSDRIKDMIIYGGENVYPAEIEAALCAFPAIAEAAVIGVPDDRFGETIKAVLVLRPGETFQKKPLIQFLRPRLADFKIPKSFDLIERLPRNPSGKVLKRELRAPYWQDRARQVN